MKAMIEWAKEAAAWMKWIDLTASRGVVGVWQDRTQVH